MDGKITISASTLDEAITKALIELQTTSEHLQYEVIQKESTGLLGIFGKKPCIIEAHVMSEAEEKAAAEAKKLEEKKAAEEAKKAEKARKAEEARKAAEKEAEKKAEEAKKTEPAKTAASAPKNEVSEKPAQKREAAKTAPETEKESSAEETPKKTVKINEEAVKKAAKEFLNQVFGAMGMQVSIETSYLSLIHI